MTSKELLKKRLLFCFLIAYFLAGYFACSYVNMHKGVYIDLSFPFEADIPFFPVFIIGYISVYLGLFLTYAVIDDYFVFRKTFYFFFLVSTVHFVLFLLVPVRMNRPELANPDGIMTLLTKYYYMIDNPVNCFPSLHVSYPLAGTLVLWNYKRFWGYVLAVFTLFVAVSVILVKQHYIIDIIGAFTVTVPLYAFLREFGTGSALLDGEPYLYSRKSLR